MAEKKQDNAATDSAAILSVERAQQLWKQQIYETKMRLQIHINWLTPSFGWQFRKPVWLCKVIAQLDHPIDTLKEYGRGDDDRLLHVKIGDAIGLHCKKILC